MLTLTLKDWYRQYYLQSCPQLMHCFADYKLLSDIIHSEQNMYITYMQNIAKQDSHRIYIKTVSSKCLLSTLLIQFKLVYGPFRKSKINSTLDFCPRPSKKETKNQSISNIIRWVPGLLGGSFRCLMVQYFNNFCKIPLTIIFIIFIILYFLIT